MENKITEKLLPLVTKAQARWQALSQREKIMLNVLLWILILAGCWLFISAAGGEQKEISLAIKQMEKQVQELEQAIPFKDKIEEQTKVFAALLEKENQKYYSEKETDTYQFGELINNLVKKEGLKVINYKTIEFDKKINLEFTVSGNAYNFFSFLYKVSTADKYWNISRLTMKNENLRGELTAIFRIKYEQMAPVAN